MKSNREKNLELFGKGIFLLGANVFFISQILSWIIFLHAGTFLTDGKVIEKYPHPVEPINTAYEVEFFDKDGARHKIINITGYSWDKNRFELNDSVRIIYNERNPSQAFYYSEFKLILISEAIILPIILFISILFMKDNYKKFRTFFTIKIK